MKTRNVIIATTLVFGLSASAHAAPKGLDNLLSRLVSHAVSITAEEVTNDVTQAVANTVYHVDNTSAQTSVKITEITAVKPAKDEE